MSPLDKRDNLHDLIDSRGWSLLHYSAAHGNAISTRWLLDHGLNVNAQNNIGVTPLMLAILNLKDHVFRVLLKFNAKVDFMERYRCPIVPNLHKAWLGKSMIPAALMLKFLEKCETVEEAAIKLFNAECPLSLVAILKNTELIEFFLKRGVNSNDRENRTSALHVAIMYHDLKSVKRLVEYGADVNVEASSGFTPLMCLRDSVHCKDEQLEILKFLLEKGANLYTPTITHHHMPIMNIFKVCKKETIRYLLQTNVDLIAKDKRGYVALHWLALNKNPGILQLIRDQPIDVNARDPLLQRAPLHLACEYGHHSAVQFLLDMGAKVDACCLEVSAKTPLQIAVTRKNSGSKYVELLLQYGADVQNPYIFDKIMERKTFVQIRPVLAHLAILQSTGTVIKKEVMKKICSNSEFLKPFTLYKHQLEQWRKIVLCDSVSLFELLTKSERELLFYLRNQELVLKLTHLSCQNSLNTYLHRKLKQRLATVFPQVNLKIRAAVSLCQIMGLRYNSHPTITDEICNYLGDADLLQLAQVSNVYNRQQTQQSLTSLKNMGINNYS